MSASPLTASAVPLVRSGMSGVVAGHVLNPLVSRGDGLVRLAAVGAD